MFDIPNENVWNESCRSQLAQSISITGNSIQSTKLVDNSYYPYSWELAGNLNAKRKGFLEVGLGSDSPTQLVAEIGGKVAGAVAAKGPRRQTRHRLSVSGSAGEVADESCLALSFPVEEVVAAEAVRSADRSGDITVAMSEFSGELCPGGELFIMAYTAPPYRRWIQKHPETSEYSLAETASRRKFLGRGGLKSTVMCDSNSARQPARSNPWIWKKSAKWETRKFEKVGIQRNEIYQATPFALPEWECSFDTALAELVGLYPYVWARENGPRL